MGRSRGRCGGVVGDGENIKVWIRREEQGLQGDT